MPWALDFHAACRDADLEGGPVDIGAGGARGPGKSHSIFAQLTIDDCMRVPGLKGLFLRQTGKSADESFQALIDKVIAGRLAYTFNASKGVLKFANGSKVILGGFEDDKDIDKYVGIEYDVIAIEERNQLTGDKVLKLKGSLRSTKKNWRARMYSSFNPGNIGHGDIKTTFVDPHKTKTETKTRFFPSTYRDNPFLQPEYIEYLNSLPGALGKAWREGNFDTFEGQYFIEWDYNMHVIPPFPLSPFFKKFRAYDHGRANAACCKWYALDYDGRLFVYRELYVKGWNAEDIAKEIDRLSFGEVYEYSVADPAIFANMGFVDKYGGQTIAETFAHCGIIFVPASNRRVDGWNLMHSYLHWDSNIKDFEGRIIPPKILYFNTCYDSIRTIPTLIHDDLHPEDVNTDGEDHAADTDRYMLMTLHERKTLKPLTDVEKKLAELKKQTNG